MSTDTKPASLDQGPAPGPWIAVAILVVVGVALLVIPAGRFGLWEPWETSWAELGRAMRVTGTWFDPKLGDVSAPRPLLTLWLIALGNALGNGGELGMRLPMGLSILGGAVALFAWLRVPFGNLRALLASLAVMVSPLVLLSGLSLAGNGVLVGALILAVSLFGMLLSSERERPWALLAGLGAALALCVLSGGLWGLFLPASTFGAVAAMRAQTEGGERLSDKALWSMAGGWAATVGAVLGWLYWQDGNPMAIHVSVLVCAVATIVTLHLVGIRTRIWAQLGGLRALLVYGPPIVVALAIAFGYEGGLGTATPGDNRLPALALLLDNFLQTRTALEAHVGFEFWIHQIGFGALPWSVFLPFALAYLIRRDEGLLAAGATNDDGSVDSQRLVLAWFAMPFVATAVLGTVHRFYLFPAIAPVAVSAVLMLTDRGFWRWLRGKPLLVRTIGLVAIFGALFFCKDLERFPEDLAGPLLTDGKFEFPEDFRYGVGLKVTRNILVAVLAVYFFGGVSLVRRLLRGFKMSRDEQLRAVEGYIPDAASGGENEPENENENENENDNENENELEHDNDNDNENENENENELELELEHENDNENENENDNDNDYENRLDAPPVEFLIEEGLRHSPGPLSAVARWVETPARFGIILVGLAVIWGLLVGFSWVPKISDHLSLKGLLVSYEKSAKDGEKLASYLVPKAQSSYYLSDLEPIRGAAGMKDKMLQQERIFIILPRDRLSSVNYEIRKATEPRRNLHVIDNRSSRFVLASNKLGPGETEQSPVANAILPSRPKPVYPITATDEKGQKAYPQFDNRVQLLGYEVYDPEDVDEWGNPTPEARKELEEIKARGEEPVFQTGKTMVIRYYFKVLKRIPSAYKMFLHVDYPGTRINGDHVPVGGTMPTNNWLPGDYIVDTQYLPVERGSSSGSYELFMGFFQGNRRMKVTPKAAHDGVDRVRMGKITVATF